MMKKLSLKWFYKNWREIIGIPFLAVVFVGLCISLATTDPERKYEGSRRQLQTKFENEMKEINLPKTVVDNFEKSEKSELVTTRYRTVLYQHEFIAHIKKELKKKDWIFYQ